MSFLRFQKLSYKTVIEVIQGQRDIPSACEEMNKTWQVAMQSFNPVTDAKSSEGNRTDVQKGLLRSLTGSLTAP